MRLSIVVAVVLALGLAQSACKKSHSTSSDGGPVYNDYYGTWRATQTPDNKTGACTSGGTAPSGRDLGSVAMLFSTGGVIEFADHPGLTGMMSSTGTWNVSGTLAPGCGDANGTFNASGGCTSRTNCTGPYTFTSSSSGGGETGNLRFQR